MAQSNRVKPRVFLDSDVVIAGITSTTDFASSLILIRLAEIQLIEAICSNQIIEEVQRVLQAKMPDAEKYFKRLVKQAIKVKSNPNPAEQAVCQKLASKFYVPILSVAVRENCSWLATFNENQYLPGHPEIVVARPDEFVSRLRGQFAWQGG